MARRRRRNRGFKGQHVINQYATYSNGQAVSITAKMIGIPADRPCKPLWASFKFICDTGIAYVSPVVIDGNREVCSRGSQQMITTFPSRCRLRVFKGTDYDHYAPSDSIISVDVLFQSSTPPKFLSVQAVICVALGPRNVNSYGFNHVDAEHLAINDEVCTVSALNPNQLTTSRELSSLGSSYRRLSL